MSNTEVQQPVSTSKPVRLLAAVAAGAAILAGGLPQLTPDKYDWVGAAVGLIGLVITGVVAKLTENATVPYENVASRYIDQTGQLVAGPAATLKTGTVVQEPKELTPQA